MLEAEGNEAEPDLPTDVEKGQLVEDTHRAWGFCRGGGRTGGEKWAKNQE